MLIILGINQNFKENNFETFKEAKKYYPSAALVMYDTELRSFKTVPSLGVLIDGYVLKTNAMDNLFAVTVPISGGRNPALAKNSIDVPVWAFHGAKDRSVSMIDGIKKMSVLKKLLVYLTGYLLKS